MEIIQKLVYSVDRDELVFHWHARTVQYVMLNILNIDALSIITLLRHTTEAATGTPYHSKVADALNRIKLIVKNGELTPLKAFNLITAACDNPALPEQHHWPTKHADTIMESIINNFEFNGMLGYITGWPIQFPDNPEALAPGEIKSTYNQTLSLISN